LLRHVAEERAGVAELAMPGFLLLWFTADVQPAEQLFVLLEPVRLRHRLGPRVPAGAPYDAPSGFIEQQAEHMRDAGRRCLLLPTRYLLALADTGHDRDQQRRTQRFGRRRLIALSLRDRGAERHTIVAAQFDQPPRLQR